MGTLFGTRNTCICYHLIDGCNSLRRRTHLPKRRAEIIEDIPRKRRRPLPVANSAAGGLAPAEGVNLNGFIFQAPGRGRSTESSSSSSSSDTSSDTSSDDTSSNSESASESTSGSSSDSDSDSTSSSSDSLVRRVPRPPPTLEHQRKRSQPRYVTSTPSRVYLSAAFVPQACPSATRIWESADP